MSNNYSEKSYNLLNKELIKGNFTATIADYKEVPALIDDDNTVIRDAFIKVTLNLSNNELLETRWYSKRISYIMFCINNQFSEITYSLKDLLEKCRTEKFNVQIDVDPKYGYQIDYK